MKGLMRTLDEYNADHYLLFALVWVIFIALLMIDCANDKYLYVKAWGGTATIFALAPASASMGSVFKCHKPNTLRDIIGFVVFGVGAIIALATVIDAHNIL